MKLFSIIALFTISFVVEGAFWASAVQPVILGIGALLSAIDLEVIDIEPIEWSNIFSLEKTDD